MRRSTLLDEASGYPSWSREAGQEADLAKWTWATIAAPVLLTGAVAYTAPAVAGGVPTGVSFYELSMASAAPASGISDVSGRVVDSLKRPSCAAYHNDSEMVMRLEASGMTLEQTAKASYVEEADRLEFDATMTMNGAVAETAKGSAQRRPDGSIEVQRAGTAEPIILDGPIAFPVAMTHAAVEAALAGKDRLQINQYDGLGSPTLVHAMDITIGEASTAPVEGLDPALAEKLGLTGLRHWPIRFASFERQSGNVDQTPEFTISSEVFENGFAMQAIYDFGAFAMRLDLVDFQPEEGAADCGD